MSELHLIACPQNRKLNVVFVHGLGGHWQTTWAHDGLEENYWPRWLAEDMPDIGVWSLAYEAALTHWQGGAMPLADQATNVLPKLLDNAEILTHRTVFICHSLGGLLVKQVMRLADGRCNAGDGDCRRLLDHYAGCVFLATPHAGATIPVLLDAFGLAAQPSTATLGLKSEDPYLRELNEWYRHWSVLRTCRHQAFYETQACDVVDLGESPTVLRKAAVKLATLAQHKTIRLVVDETSANPHLAFVYPQAVPASHLTISKPKRRGGEPDDAVRTFLLKMANNPPKTSILFEWLPQAERELISASVPRST